MPQGGVGAGRPGPALRANLHSSLGHVPVMTECLHPSWGSCPHTAARRAEKKGKWHPGHPLLTGPLPREPDQPGTDVLAKGHQIRALAKEEEEDHCGMQTAPRGRVLIPGSCECQPHSGESSQET